MDMCPDPERKALGKERFSIGVIARPQYRHKYLSLSNLPCERVNDRYCLAGKVDKHLLTGTVFLTHTDFQGFSPAVVVFRKLRMLISLRKPFLVFKPQKLQCDALLFQLKVNLLHIGKRAPDRLGYIPLLIEYRFKGCVIEIFRKRPG